MKRSIRVSLLISASLLAAASPGAAQTPGVPGPPEGGDDQARVEDIVVTATRRSANLQDVPATIQAVSSSTLASLNILNAVDLPALVPGLAIGRGGGVEPFLRGVGTINAGFTTEPATAVYIDGLYTPNSSSGVFSFNNIEQIEVLKGPQGTLYGRNVTGGLIQVITRDPGAEPRIDASAGYGNYDTVTLNFYGSTPITDTLGINVSGVYAKQNDGYGLNVVTGNQNLKSDEQGVQFKLQWKPAPGTKITLRGFYDHNNSDEGIIQAILPGTVGVDGTPYLGEYRNASRRDALGVIKQYNFALKVEHDFGFATASSLTGYQHASGIDNYTLSGIPGNPVTGQAATEINLLGISKTFSQEFQLTSKPSHSRFDWIVGAFYYHDDTETRSQVYGTCVNGVCAGALPTQVDGFPTTRSYSFYGDGGYRFWEGTKLTVGLRYTSDTKALTGLAQPFAGQPNSPASLPATVPLFPGAAYPGNPNGIPTSATFDKLTYRVVLTQDVTSDIHAYASYNLGFRSGGFNPLSFSNPVARPEILGAYEVGVKSDLFDRRLRLNLSAFYYDYKDIQLRSAAPPAPPGVALLINAAAAHLRGIDGDLTLVPVRHLTITGGFEILDAKYASFPGASFSVVRPIGNGVLGGTISSTRDLAGFPVIFSPDFSASLGFVYTIDSSVGSFALAANDAYKSSYSFVSDAAVKQSPYHLVNASITWTAKNKHYDLQLYVKNLTASYYYTSGFDAVSGNDLYTPAAPRTYGFTVGYHY